MEYHQKCKRDPSQNSAVNSVKVRREDGENTYINEIRTCNPEPIEYFRSLHQFLLDQHFGIRVFLRVVEDVNNDLECKVKLNY